MKDADYTEIIERLLLELEGVPECMQDYNIYLEEMIPLMKEHLPNILVNVVRSVGIDKVNNEVPRHE